jgi:hypothetical protein
LTWLGACAGSALIIAGTSPTAAHAAATSPQLYFPNLVLPIDSTGNGQGLQLTNLGDAIFLHDAVVSIDTTKLAGVASATATEIPGRPKCTTAAGSITCPIGELAVSANNGGQGLFDLAFTPATGAQLDQKGEVTFTLTARDRDPLVKTSTVTIAEGVNLTAGPDLALQSKPGGQVAMPATVRNSGTTTVHETVFDTSLPYDAFTFTKRYSNCGYAGSWVVCRFHDDLLPGKEYTLSEPMVLGTRPDTPAPQTLAAYLHWETAADADTWLQDTFPGGTLTPGSAGDLHLVAKPATLSAQAATQTDPANGDNFAFARISVTGDNRGDLAAVGTTVKGAAGTTVTARIGIQNLGPARIGLSDGAAAEVRVTVPKGTTVVSIPQDCWPSNGQADPTGAAEYLCYTNTATIDVGGTYTWDLGLRIDSSGETTGTFTAQAIGNEANPSNNTARIVVNSAAEARAGGSSRMRSPGPTSAPTAPPRATSPSRSR